MDANNTVMVNSSAEKTFPCTFCDKIFSRRKNLNLHLCIHTGERKQICTICNKQFIQSCHLKRHYRSHAGEKPFRCEICGKNFSQNGHLKVHIQSHLGNKNFMCEYCQKTFVQNSHLKRHLRSHLSERPYVCTYCSKSYKFSDHLHAHVRTHTGELPYKCDNCNKKFHTSANLNAHKRVHNKYVDRKFKCLLCAKKFHSKHSLSKHLTVHSQEKPFSCTLCHRKFKQKSKLKTHFEGHKKELENNNNLCVICEKTFTGLSTLKEHMLEHCINTTYVCNICDKVFRVNSSLQMHYSLHTGCKMAYRCLEIQCEQEFNTIDNIREHMKIRHTARKKDQKSELLKVVEGRYLEEQESVGESSQKGETEGEDGNKCDLSPTGKRYKCPVKCGAAFKTVTTLCNHLQIHIGDEADDTQEEEEEDEECNDEEEDQEETESPMFSHSNRQIQGESNFRKTLVKTVVEQRNQDRRLVQDKKQSNESMVTIDNVEPISLSKNPMFHIGQVCSELLTVDYGQKQDPKIQTTATNLKSRTSQGDKPNQVVIESDFVETNKTSISSSIMLPDQSVITESEKVQPVVDSNHSVTFEPVSSDLKRLNSQNAEFVILQTPSGTKKSVLVPSQGVLSCVQGLLRVGEVVLQDSVTESNGGQPQIENTSSKVDKSDKAQDQLQAIDGTIFHDTSIDSIGIETEEVVSQEPLSEEEDKLRPQNTMFHDSSRLIADHSDYFQGHKESDAQDDLESSGFPSHSYAYRPEPGHAVSSSSSSSENVNTFTSRSIDDSRSDNISSAPTIISGIDENSYQRQLIEMGHDYPSNAFISSLSNNDHTNTPELRVNDSSNLLDTDDGCSKCTGLPSVMFECPLCDSYFNSKSQLKEHLQTHLGEGQRTDNILVSIVMYMCHMCDEEFNDKDSLKKHIQTKHNDPV